MKLIHAKINWALVGAHISYVFLKKINLSEV